MRIREFIFSAQRNARIKRHLLFLSAGFAFMVITYPPTGAGTQNGFASDGFAAFYEMVLIRTAFHLLFQMLFCYPLLYFLMPWFFWKRKYLRFGALLLLLWMAITVIRFMAFNFVYNPIMQQLHLYVNPAPMLYLNSFRQTLTGPAFIAYFFILLKLFKDWQQRQVDNFNIKKQNAVAELQLLKAQIHPHFLFNTLNNIYAFTLSKSPQAKVIVKKLEALLHYMIEECEQPLVSVQAELNMLQDYFDLERIRYGNSLDMEFQVAGDVGQAMVVPLLMIPFVENSFKHGTSKMLRAPWIRLFIQVDDDRLHFTLANNKPAEATPTPASGIGLHNVKKRLDLLYPGTHLLLIDATPNTFTVNMQLPLMRQAARTEAG